jgi:hypothetical protein
VRLPQARAEALPILSFIAVSVLLAGMLVPRAFTHGEVLTQSSLLYQYLPWQSYAPRSPSPTNPLLFDPAFVFYPFLTHAVEAVHRWELPRWSAALYGGHPFLAAFQTAVFSPFTAIAYVVALPRATVFIALAPLVVGGLGMFLYVRAIGLGPPAAWFAGIAYLLNGFAVAWMEHPLTAVACWAPWILRATDALRMRPDASRAATLAAFVALVILSGHPETATKVLLLAAAYTVASLLVDPKPRWGLPVLAYASGVLLASIQIVPFVEYLTQSEALASRRAHAISSFFMPASTMIAGLVPDFFGNPARGNYLILFNRFGGQANYAEQAVYAGIAVVVLAPVALVCRRREWRVPVFVASAVASGALMYGLPGVVQAVSWVPLLRVMVLSRFGLLAIFSTIVLAAYGIDTLTRDLTETATRIRRMVLAASALVVAAIGIGWLGMHDLLQSHGHTETATGGIARTIALLLIVWGLVSLRCRRALAPRVFAIAMCSVVAIDLSLASRGLHPTMPASQVYPPLPELEAIQRDSSLFRVYGWGNALVPNAALVYGLQDVRGWDGVNPYRFTRLLDLGYLRQVSNPDVHLRDPTLLDLLNVKYLFVDPTAVLTAPRYTRVPGTRVPLYENTHVFPRAFLVHDYAVLADEALKRTLHDGSADLSRVALLEAELPPDDRPQAADEGTTAGTAQILTYRDTVVEIAVASSTRALLIVSDAYYPGWIATIDGREAAIRRADFALRAVAIPPGRHVVRFEYRPLSIRLGMLISLTTIGGLVGSVLTSRVRRRRAQHENGSDS